MIQQRERVVGGRVNSEHLVQLFDDDESRAESVALFLFEGWQQDETLLVAAHADHWVSASRQLSDLGCPVAEMILTGRLVVLDAATALATFTGTGRPVAAHFETNIADTVKSLAVEFGRPLRIYGEMVDLLAAQGDFAAARELERMWNTLNSECSITLLCGYASGHFGDERTVDALRDICAAHDRVVAKPTDLLGSWLLAESRPSPQIDL